MGPFIGREWKKNQQPFPLNACVTFICIAFIACGCDFIVGANKEEIQSKHFYFMDIWQQK